MLRFLAALFKIDYKTCETCEVLKAEIDRRDEVDDRRECDSCVVLQAQLDHALEREKELIERLLDLTKPEIIPTQPVRVGNTVIKTRSFREAAKIREDQDRIAASKIKKISELEKELKIPGTEAEAEAESAEVEDKEFNEMAGINADDSSAREA